MNGTSNLDGIEGYLFYHGPTWAAVILKNEKKKNELKAHTFLYINSF